MAPSSHGLISLCSFISLVAAFFSLFPLLVEHKSDFSSKAPHEEIGFSEVHTLLGIIYFI